MTLTCAKSKLKTREQCVKFLGDEVFRKRSAVRDYSLHLILILEAAA